MQSSTYNLLFVALLFSSAVFGQVDAQSNAFNYLETISSVHHRIAQSNVDYFQCAVHCQEPQQVEAARLNLLQTLSQALAYVQTMPMLENDGGLREVTINSIKAQKSSCEKEYVTLNQMLATEEDAADFIDRYYALLEAEERKLERIHENLSRAQRTFAAKNDIHLVEEEGESIFALINRVNAYYRSLEKPTQPLESRLLRLSNALGEGSYRTLEDARFNLEAEVRKAQYAVSQVKDFEGDAELLQATKAYLDLLQTACKTHFTNMVNYLRSPDNSKLDGYNNAVDFYNNTLNPAQSALFEARDAFLKRHIPELPKGVKTL